MTIIRNLDAVLRMASDIKSRLQYPTSIPVVYFTDKPNVGDLLNEYLIPKISGRNIIKVRSSMQPHLRAIGSVVGSASGYSKIWGSGSINGSSPKRKLRKENVHALRGRYTLELVSQNLNESLEGIPLGDPALLMPRFFLPVVDRQDKVGIIPHFSDEAQVKVYLEGAGVTDVELISVQQDPECFISQMCACQAIYSSSLHGLILADSYGIPNKWISISGKLLGGDFKFMDYYSTTISPHEKKILISGSQGLIDIIENTDRYCAVKSFIGDEDALLNSFPACYVRTS